MTRLLSILVLSFVFVLPAYADSDAPHSSDHPMISRYPGSNIITYVQKDFDEYQLPLSEPKLNTYPVAFEKSKTLQGKLTRIGYALKPGTSTLKIYTNFDTALKKAGFKTLFSCVKQACGNSSSWQGFFLNSQIWGKAESQRMLSAHKQINGQDVYVVIFVGEQGPRIGIGVDVVEVKQMQTDLVTIDENGLQQMLDNEGKAALYGIQFETDKAVLLPSSQQTLDVIAGVLKKNPKIRVYIVGHTDDTGSNDHNMQLSNQRAQAVIQALISQHKINQTRLTAFGVGPYAPVGNNSSEQGRQLNRRVEIIKRL